MAYSCGKKRKECRNLPEGPDCFVFNWFTEVVQVLGKPSIAITTFILGVGFIIIASKEVRWSIELLEKFGAISPVKEDNNVLGNLMFVVVFLYVWINIVALGHLARWAMHAYTAICRWYTKAKQVFLRMSEEELEEQQQQLQQQQQQHQQQHRHGRCHD
ncbi:hypothetical protein Btru_024123 [Bulinus truncatus]|nr:hypothetical protein Btru_024123 [Bulinus truncatus]